MLSKRMLVKICCLVGLVLSTSSAQPLSAQIITAFDFEHLPIAINNSPTPTVGSGFAISLGMTNNYGGINNVATCDVLTDAGSSSANRAWRIRSAGTGNGNGWHQLAPQYTQGAQFSASTVGFKDIIVTYDMKATTQGVKHHQAQYTVDGTTWTNIGPLRASPNTEQWMNGLTLDFSAISAANNNPLFGIRIVSAYAPLTTQYVNLAGNPINNTSGNWRIDSVRFSGTAVPEPGLAGVCLLGLAVLGASIRRRI